MSEGGEAPWWLALAAGVVTTLVATIGKLWQANNELRREAAARAELDAARSERATGEHHRDLRRVIWGPTNPPQK